MSPMQTRSLANLNWSTLGFDYVPTNAMVKHNFKDGSWDAGEVTADFSLNIHALSNVLHYGQGIFEGLKAFHLKDGSVCSFNATSNAARMARGAARLQMPAPSDEMFASAIERVVTANIEFMPPYGTGGALYIRPFLFGHGAKLGLGPAPEYQFVVVASPVGAYYKGGLQAIDAVVVDEWDRAAPRGVGSIKAAGNYAPDVLPSSEAKGKGFPICLYLDAKENKYVEEFSTSNFIGITRDNKLVTPKSDSILPSCTKEVLLRVARDMGIAVEERPVLWEEVSTLKEVAACGTAVVLTPIQSITRAGSTCHFDGHETIAKLYNHVTQMQAGDIPDPYGILKVLCHKPHES